VHVQVARIRIALVAQNLAPVENHGIGATPIHPQAAIPKDNGLNRFEGLLTEMLVAVEPALYNSIEESLLRPAYSWSGKNQAQTAKVLSISINILPIHLKCFGLSGREVNSALPELVISDASNAVHAAN
jgi:hypothetical protein